MSIRRAEGPARQRRRPAGRRIRFREAVPAWRDRRDLRRRFRRAARAAAGERKAEMTALLQRLAAGRVPLSQVAPGPGAQDGVIGFADGTRLLLVTRRRGAGLRWLRDRHCGPGARVWLVRAQPSFAGCQFRLWFATAGAARPAEVLAKVGPLPR